MLKLQQAMQAVRERARPLHFDEADYDSLLDAIGERRIVLIGEASHGTEDFYRERARITRRLLEDCGFQAVAAEADWPDAYRVNRWVRGESDDTSPEQALDGFRRFPQWMWRNTEVVHFTSWLHRRNALLPDARRAGFYGLDLYSLHASAEAVLAYLDKADSAAAARARQRYGCFEDFGEDTQAYGYAANLGLTESCEREVVEQLMEMQRRAAGLRGDDAEFSAEQNARLVRDAERYYRTMFSGRVNSWNVRDCHMVETLERLLQWLGPASKIVIWAHNSHLGDARATDMSRRGEYNLGQLVRERYGDAAFLIGQTTYDGEVTAAHDWDAPAERRRVRRALPGSWEELFHEAAATHAAPHNFWLCLREEPARSALRGPLLERAIGVIYRPATERLSHYFNAKLSEQFDAVVHLDRTAALHPLEKNPTWHAGEPAETFPSGI